jgi:hypothetical protein
VCPSKDYSDILLSASKGDELTGSEQPETLLEIRARRRGELKEPAADSLVRRIADAYDDRFSDDRAVGAVDRGLE